GVGAGDDEVISAVFGFDGGADFVDVFVAFDDFFAAHVAALLGPDLIFQKTPGRAGGDQFLHGADDVEWISVAGVGIDDDGDAYGSADVACALGEFGVGEQAEVRLADSGGGLGVGGGEATGETSAPRGSRAD